MSNYNTCHWASMLFCFTTLTGIMISEHDNLIPLIDTKRSSMHPGSSHGSILYRKSEAETIITSPFPMSFTTMVHWCCKIALLFPVLRVNSTQDRVLLAHFHLYHCLPKSLAQHQYAKQVLVQCNQCMCIKPHTLERPCVTIFSWVCC